MSEKKRAAIYARVSTPKQSLDTQLLPLREYAQRWDYTWEEYADVTSGAQGKRPALDALMNDARRKAFDVVIVWRFDRFARSTRHLVNTLEEFQQLGIGFFSYQEALDTSTPMGQFIFTVISAIAQLERDIIKDRVDAGLHRARRRGVKLGRPTVKIDAQTIRHYRNLGYSYKQIAKWMGVSDATVRRRDKNPNKNVDKESAPAAPLFILEEARQ